MLQLKLSTSAAVKRLSLSECLELVKCGTCERFLRVFTVDCIPKANSWWDSVRLVDCELVEVMKTASSVMVTYDGEEHSEICSISFSELMLLKTKLKSGTVEMQVQYFGTSLEDLIEHARAHLIHSVAATRGRDVDFVLNIPTCIALDVASAHISDDILQGFRMREASVNYLACLSRSDIT